MPTTVHVRFNARVNNYQAGDVAVIDEVWAKKLAAGTTPVAGVGGQTQTAPWVQILTKDEVEKLHKPKVDPPEEPLSPAQISAIFQRAQSLATESRRGAR